MILRWLLPFHSGGQYSTGSYPTVMITSADSSSRSAGWLASWPTRPPKLSNNIAPTAPAAWKVPTTGRLFLLMKVWSAWALVGLLASIPSSTTGFDAALMRRAASLIAAPSAGPRPAKAGADRGSCAQGSVITSLGKLTYDAPGLPDSAARKALASTSLS